MDLNEVLEITRGTVVDSREFFHLLVDEMIDSLNSGDFLLFEAAAFTLDNGIRRALSACLVGRSFEPEAFKESLTRVASGRVFKEKNPEVVARMETLLDIVIQNMLEKVRRGNI